MSLYVRVRAGLIRVNFNGRCASPAEHRFWACVSKSGPMHPVLGTRCWLWLGGRNQKGYGRIGVGGRLIRAHRYSWELHCGPVPDDLPDVCHHCDNQSCVRPDHLFVGTNTDNVADRDAKDRQAKGERNSAAVLNDDLVRQIRRRYIPRCRVNGILAIALDLGVGVTAIWRIVNRITWRHVVD